MIEMRDPDTGEWGRFYRGSESYFDTDDEATRHAMTPWRRGEV
jgi:hypothetical protein